MLDLLVAVQEMLGQARLTARRDAGQSASGLHQLVLIVADGRFHERDALRRMVAVCLIA